PEDPLETGPLGSDQHGDCGDEERDPDDAHGAILPTAARPFVSAIQTGRGVYKPSSSVQAVRTARRSTPSKESARAGLDASSVLRSLGDAHERALRQGEVAPAVLRTLRAPAVRGRPLLLRVRAPLT